MSKKRGRVAGANRKILPPNKKVKKVKVDLQNTQLNLIDVEPIISRQRRDRKGQELGEIHLPDLDGQDNRR